jgi:hypothetical protein
LVLWKRADNIPNVHNLSRSGVDAEWFSVSIGACAYSHTPQRRKNQRVAYFRTPKRGTKCQ